MIQERKSKKGALAGLILAAVLLGAFLLVRRLSREDEFIQGSRYW